MELTEHGLHAVCSDWLASGWYESLEHGMACSAVHQKPGSHEWHAVCPAASWKVPRGHRSQLVWPERGLNSPKGQGVSATLATPVKWPFRAGLHSSGWARSVAFEKRPAAHGSAVGAPNGQ